MPSRRRRWVVGSRCTLSTHPQSINTIYQRSPYQYTHNTTIQQTHITHPTPPTPPYPPRQVGRRQSVEDDIAEMEEEEDPLGEQFTKHFIVLGSLFCLSRIPFPGPSHHSSHPLSLTHRDRGSAGARARGPAAASGGRPAGTGD